MMCGMPHPDHRICKTIYAHTASHSVNGCVDYKYTLRLGHHFHGSYRCPMPSFRVSAMAESSPSAPGSATAPSVEFPLQTESHTFS